MSNCIEHKNKPNPMTTLNLKEIQERVERATPGKWNSIRNDMDCGIIQFCIELDDMRCIARTDDTVSTAQVKANAAFIAAARTDIPLLIEAVKEMAQTLEFYGHASMGEFDDDDGYKALVALKKWSL